MILTGKIHLKSHGDINGALNEFIKIFTNMLNKDHLKKKLPKLKLNLTYHG